MLAADSPQYLVKTHIYNPPEDIEDQWKNFWLTAADSTKEHIALHPYGHPELTFLSELDNDGNIEWSMDDYSCFAGGNLMLGGKYFSRPDLIALGEAAAESCHVTYNTTVTGLGPLSEFLILASRLLTVKTEFEKHLHGTTNQISPMIHSTTTMLPPAPTPKTTATSSNAHSTAPFPRPSNPSSTGGELPVTQNGRSTIGAFSRH